MSAVILIIIGLPLIINATTPVPGALVARLFIDSYNNTVPSPDYGVIEPTVTVAKDIVIQANDAPLARLNIYTPKGDGQTYPIILWIHGGSFVGGNEAERRIYATLLAHQGFTVASLDYTQAPEARYPVPVHQAEAALRYLAEQGGRYKGDPTRIVVAGNSAGAQISSQVAAIETNPQLASAMQLRPALPLGSLRGVVLNCGVYDMAALETVNFPFIRVSVWAYIGRRDWSNFPQINQLSTIYNVTAHYPPAFLTAGDADSFESQSVKFADVLRQHNVPVTTQFWHGSGTKLPHDYQFQLNRPEAQETFKNTIQFLHTVTTKGDHS